MQPNLLSFSPLGVILLLDVCLLCILSNGFHFCLCLSTAASALHETGIRESQVFQTQFIQQVCILLKMQVVEICNIYLKPGFINMQLKITDMWDRMLYN